MRESTWRMWRLPLTRLRSKGTVFLALALAGLIGLVEYSTGYDLHLTALFLVPICWASWWVGRRAGLFVALVCTAVWLVADLMTGHPYKHAVVPYWNALMLLAFFVVIVYSISAFQYAHQNLLVARSMLEEQNERLEQTVQQRTSALQSEISERKRLEKANLQAERLAMVGTIAAQVAHEVRNPLGSITLNLDLITKELDRFAGISRDTAQEGRTLVNEMREEVHRIQRVIEDYLRFARLPKLQRLPVRLDDFLEQKLAFMAVTFEKAQVHVRTEFDRGLEPVVGDAEQIWQALLNLIQNSLEAMPTGGTLVISTRSDSGQALLRVSDSGKGMSEEQLKQVFVPFFTTKPRGTGLGLPLTQQILSEHGAQIECISTFGKGTTFTIRFQLHEKT